MPVDITGFDEVVQQKGKPGIDLSGFDDVVKKKESTESSGSDSGIHGIPSASSGQDNQTGTSAIGLTKGGQKAPQETEAQRKAKYPTGTYLQKEAIPTNITDAAPPVKPTVKDQSDPAFVESVKNTTSNIGNSLSGVVPRLKLVSADVWQGLLGKDLADKWYETENRDLNQEREGALNKLKQLKEEVKPTRGIVESFEKGDKTGFAAAVVDAAGSLVSTAIPSLATGGAGLFTESIGTAIADHNEEKAKEMGVTTKELYDSGNASLRTPLVIGTLSGALENVGLKGIGKFINKKITSTGVKKVGEIFGDFNKEGLTEWVQVGLDKFNTETAKGKDATEASSEAASQMFSKDGLEAYAKGVAGAGVAGVAGKGLKSLIVSPKEQSQTEPSVSPELQNKLALTPPTEPELLGRKQGGQPVYKEQNGGQVQNETQQPSPDSGGTEQDNAQVEPVKSDVQPVGSEVNQGINAPEQATPTLIEPVSTVQHIEQAIQEHGLDEGAKLLNEETGLAQTRIDESTNNPDPNALNQPSNSNSSVAGSESAEPGRTEPEMADSTDTGRGDGKNNEGSVRGEKEVKKRVATERIYEGNFRKGIKKHLEEMGLTRTVLDLDIAESDTKQFFEDYGFDTCLEVLKNKDIDGAPATFLWDILLQDVNKQIINSESQDEIDIHEKQFAELSNMFSQFATAGGQQSAAFAKVYQNSPLKYNAEKQKERIKEINGGFISKETEDNFDKWAEQIKVYEAKIKEYEAREKEMQFNNAISDISDDVKRNEKEKLRKEKQKKARENVKSGLDEMMGAFASMSGGKLSAVDPQENFKRGAKKAIDNLIIDAGISFEEAFEKLKQLFLNKGGNPSILDSIKADLELQASEEDLIDKGLKISKSEIRAIIQKGITDPKQVLDILKEKYPEYSDREIKDAVSGYGKTFKPKDQIESEINKLKALYRAYSQLEDISQGKRPLKSGPQRDEMDVKVRELMRQVREALKTLPLDLETKEGMLKTALDAKKRHLSNRIEDLTNELETHKRVKKQKGEPLNDNETLELEAKLKATIESHDLMFADEINEEKKAFRLKLSEESLASRIKTIEDELAKGEKSKVTPKENLTNEKVETLKKELDILKEVRDYVLGEKKQKVDNSKSLAIERKINGLIDEIESGKIKDKILNKKELTEEEQKLADRAEILKGVHENVFSEEIAKRKEESRLRSSKGSIKKRIDSLTDKIKTGDYTKTKPTLLIADTELKNLRASRDLLKEKFDTEYEKVVLKNRTGPKIAQDAAADVWRLAQLLQVGIDLGVMGIQGMNYTLKFAVTTPAVVKDAFVNGMKHLASKEKQELWLSKAKQEDWYKDGIKSGLSITKTNAKAGAKEELFFSTLVDVAWKKINPFEYGKLKDEKKAAKWDNYNPINMFERFGQSYMNTLRAKRWVDMRNKLIITEGKSFESNPKEFKDVAGTINTFTGRASLDFLEPSAQNLALLFYSPRNLMSIIKQVSPYGLARFALMTEVDQTSKNKYKVSRAQKMAVSDFATMVSTTMGIVGLMALHYNNDDDDDTGVNVTDPTKPDFLKFVRKRKNGTLETFDPWGGKMPMIVYQSRVFLGTYTTLAGKKHIIGRGMSDTYLSLTSKYFGNKLSPVTGTAVEYAGLKEKNVNGKYVKVNPYSGKPYVLTDELAELYTPMLGATLHECLEDDPDMLDGMFSFLAAIGMAGTNDNKKIEKKK